MALQHVETVFHECVWSVVFSSCPGIISVQAGIFKETLKAKEGSHEKNLFSF